MNGIEHDDDDGELEGCEWLKRSIGCVLQIWIWYTQKERGSWSWVLGHKRWHTFFIHNARESWTSPTVHHHLNSISLEQKKHEQVPNHPSIGRNTVSELQNWSARARYSYRLDIDTSPTQDLQNMTVSWRPTQHSLTQPNRATDNHFSTLLLFILSSSCQSQGWSFE